MKKYFLMAALTGFVAAPNCYASPYLGLSAGYANYYAQNGAVANLFFGNGSTFGPYQVLYLAGEAYAKIAQYSNYSNMYGYGLSVLPGFQITNTFLLYARGGLSADFPDHNTHFSTYSSHVGIGFQSTLSGSWDLRVEYVHFSTANTNNYNVGLVYKF